MIFIYTISDPISGLVKYVGKTKCPKERFRKHLSERNNTYKSKWITGLRNAGLEPVFEIIDECEESEWQIKERFYIRFYKSIGAILTNIMEGGEGGPTMKGRKLTIEQRAKISASKKGKIKPALGKTNTLTKGCPVVRTDMQGNVIEVHPSIRHAAKSINRADRRIQMMLTGNGKKVNHVGGFKFSKLNASI